MTESVLYWAGTALLLLDFFLLGTGVISVAGLAALTGGLYLTFGGGSSVLMILVSVWLAGIVIFFWLAVYFPKSRMWGKICLPDQLTSRRGFVSNAQDLSVYLHKEGYAQSALRPAGTAVIGGRVLDVVTEGEFVSPGTPVQAVNITGGHVVVRPIQK